MKEMMNFHSKELEENIILISHIICEMMFMVMFATYFTKDLIKTGWRAKGGEKSEQVCQDLVWALQMKMFQPYNCPPKINS